MLEVGRADIAVGGEAVGADDERAFVGRDSGIGEPVELVRQAVEIAGVEVVGVDDDGASVGGGGLVVVALGAEDIADAEVGIRQAGVFRQGLVEGRQGFVKVPLGFELSADAGERLGDLLIDGRDRRFDGRRRGPAGSPRRPCRASKAAAKER
mgnify:CR=1 FL=1